MDFPVCRSVGSSRTPHRDEKEAQIDFPLYIRGLV